MTRIGKVGASNAPKNVTSAVNALSDAIEVIVTLDSQNTELLEKLDRLEQRLEEVYTLTRRRWPLMLRSTLRKQLEGS